MISLSEDQQQAMDKLIAAIEGGEEVTLLTGLAGTGKTTIMKNLAAYFEDKGREVVLVCPTGKAASVLQHKTDLDATTIHKALYSRLDEDGDNLSFLDPGPACLKGGLVLCDEASMVGVQIFDDLVDNLPAGAQLLGVGDPGQLPPVGEEWGFDFDDPTAELTKIHRQGKDSPIVKLAWMRREAKELFTDWEPGVCEQSPNEDPVPWYIKHWEDDAVLLAFTNAVRNRMNRKIRKKLGHKGQLVVGDKVLCLHNNDDLGIMNGEVLDVLEVGPGGARGTTHLVLKSWLGDEIPARVRLDLIGKRVSDFVRVARSAVRADESFTDLLHLDYGFALTVHKSQGSEWKHVGFIADRGYWNACSRDADVGSRLAYTAITRARECLHIFGNL